MLKVGDRVRPSLHYLSGCVPAMIGPNAKKRGTVTRIGSNVTASDISVMWDDGRGWITKERELTKVAE